MSQVEEALANEVFVHPHGFDGDVRSLIDPVDID